MSRKLSPVIRGLRTGGDEVEFATVLSEIFRDYPVCAREFVSALVKAAGEARGRPGTRARKLTVPREVAPGRERFIRYGRRAVAKQAKSGSIDLYFTGEEFSLACELKMNSPYGAGQPLKYLDRARATHVVALVRQGMVSDLQVIDNERWLGEVTWERILPELKTLSLSGRPREQWLDLLQVMETVDKDFAENAPKLGTDVDLELVGRVGELVLKRLQKKMNKRSARAGVLADEFTLSEAWQRRSGWASIQITDTEGNEYFRISARRAGTRSPEIQVSWYPWEDQRTQRDQADQHERLVQCHDFEAMSGGYYRFQKPVLGEGADEVVKAANTAWLGVRAVDDEKLLQVDINELAG